MAPNITITAKNGTWTIVIGAPADNSAAQGGGPGDPSAHGSGSPLGGGPGDPGAHGSGGTTSGAYAPTVIGPIVIRNCSCGNATDDEGGGPGDPSAHGSGSPLGGGPGDPGAHGSGGVVSGCGGTTVIGPIVLDCGCACGASASSTAAAALPPASAVSVNPPGTPAIIPHQKQPPRATTTNLLPFIMQQQQEGGWCWAAVGVSIHNFLDPKPAGVWTQGTLATAVLISENQIAKNIDCSQTPELCNYSAALDDALNQTGNLRLNGALFNQYLTFDNLASWIDESLPVGVRIVWSGGGAHFIALDGYRTFSVAAPMVHIQDPLYGPGFQPYDDLLTDYPPDDGVWQDTYLVTA